jgi:arylsulfatase A-like enzyme
VLDELRRQGLFERTLVIFTTDNGYYHAEHGLADKWYPHEESIRVPLIVHDPRMPAARRGTTDDAFTLNVDLAPTVLAAAGVPPTPRMQGNDFSPLYLAAQRPAWRTDYFYEHATIRSTDFIPSSEALVTRDWKYFYWPDFKVEQLFHVAADPHEEHDLIADLRTAASWKSCAPVSPN